MRRKYFIVFCITLSLFFLYIPIVQAKKNTDTRITAVAKTFKGKVFNVQKYIWSNKGPVFIKDALRVALNAQFKKNVNIDNRLKVDGKSTFNGAAKFNGKVTYGGQVVYGGEVQSGGLQLESQDLRSFDTASVNAGSLYYDESLGGMRMWDGEGWFEFANADEVGDAYTAGTGLQLSSNQFSVTLGTSIDGDEIESGTITTTHIADNGCSEDQVLKFSANGWECASDTSGAAYTAGTGIDLSGTVFSSSLGTSIGASELDSGAVELDHIAQNGCSSNQVLKYSGSGWVCSTDITGGSSALDDAYNSGQSITVDEADIDVNLSDATSDYAFVVDNTTTGTIDDGFKVLTSGSGAVLTDALDLSDDGIANALNIGSNDIATTSSAISAAELDRLDGKNAALVDANDAVTTAITGTGTLTAGATGSGFTLDLDNSTISGALTLSDETNGDFVESITNGTGISGGDGGSEGAMLTLAVDEDTAFSWTNAHTWALAGTENIDIASDLAGSVDAFAIVGTPSSSAGSTSGVSIQQADSVNTNGLDAALSVDNADSDLALGTVLRITDSGGGGFTKFLDTPSLDISGSGAITGATGFTSSGTITLSGLTSCTALETNGSGVISCGDDDDTTYTAGDGLGLSGGTFSADLGSTISSAEIENGTVALVDLSDNGCAEDEILKYSGSAWECASDNAGGSVSLDGAYNTGQSITIDAADVDFNLSDATNDYAVVVDNTTSGVVDDGFLVLSSGASSTLTDALQIGSGTQTITNALNIASTGVTTDINLQNGETIDNNTDGTLTLTVDASGSVAIATGNLVVGNGTPGTTLNGEDAYIEGTLEVDNAAQFDTSVKINSGTAIAGHISVSDSFDASGVVASDCSDIGTITVTGAAVGDTVIASPEPTTNGIEDKELTWSAFVSAADTVTIRACNVNVLSTQNADTQTWRVDVWKH